jgi:hypothetical protein
LRTAPLLVQILELHAPKEALQRNARSQDLEARRIARLTLEQESGSAPFAMPIQNCRPLGSATLHFGVSEGNATNTTLAPIARIRLKDPETGLDAMLLDDSSASPTVGPDGDVYYGAVESSCCTNDDRG